MAGIEQLYVLNDDGTPFVEGLSPGCIVNITAQFHMSVDWVNVHTIAALGDIGLEYNPARFVAGTHRLRIEDTRLPYVPYVAFNGPQSQEITFLMYNSGNIIITGTNKLPILTRSAWEFALMMIKYTGIEAIPDNIRIENIVCNYYLGFKIDLWKFTLSESDLCDYQPDNFPAAMYTECSRKNPKFTALVNHTGRIIITGSRDKKDSINLFKRLYIKLLKFKCDGTFSTVYPNPELRAHNDTVKRHKAARAMLSRLNQKVGEHNLDAIDSFAPEYGIADLRQVASIAH
jgi:TATA-box binding protein (TBP) (component of TFIID and TFIIIB)